MSKQTVSRDSFIFYRSFYEAIKELPDEEKGRVYNAIFMYALDGEFAQLSGVEKAIFTLVKPQIDANQRRYENGSKGAEYGKLGGRPSNKEKHLENPKETPKKPLENPKLTPNVNVNVNENDNVNDKDILGGVVTPQPPKEVKNKKGVRLSADWELDQSWGDWALKQGLSVDEVLKQEEIFKDYWTAKAGKDAVKLDWQSTWRNWIRRHIEKKGTKTW